MNQLEKYVLEFIGENTDSPDVFTDTDAGLEPIRESLNDAIDEITLVTGSYKETYRLPLATDQMFYRLKTYRGALAYITDAWLVGERRRLHQSDLIRMTSWNPRWMDCGGAPDWYLPIGNEYIGFVPRPAGDGDVVELTMVVTPPRMAQSTDRIRLRESFQWAAVHYAVGEFWATRGDAKEASVWHKRYLDQLGLMGIYPKQQSFVPQLRTDKQPPK